jgi:hypothetical protein
MLCMLLGVIAWARSRTAPPPLPRAPNARITTLTAPGYFTEPSVAIDPNDPQHVVVAYQVNASVAFSRDAGRTWALAQQVEPPDYKRSGDVSITFDNQGAAIVCFIAFDRLGTTAYWGHNATRNGVFVRRSLDGGATWEPQYRAVLAWPTEPRIPFEDKPYIVADQTRGPFAGNLYVGWTEFRLDSSLILFSRSIDRGDTWSKPIRISTRAGLPRDDNGSVEGFTGAVAPDGTLYVVWADGAHVVLTSSRDGGKTFAPSRAIITTAPSYFQVADVDRANGFPQIAVDPRGAGRLYVTWSDYRHGDVDVFAAASADRGRTWTGAVRVNSDSLHNGSDQFFQWLAVDPADGAVNLAFYDRRGDPTNRHAIMVLARSTDGGRSFANYAWTDTAFAARDEFVGDYTGIAAFGGRVVGAWAEIDSAAAAVPGQAPQAHHAVVRVGVADFNTDGR